MDEITWFPYSALCCSVITSGCETVNLKKKKKKYNIYDIIVSSKTDPYSSVVKWYPEM